MDEILKSLRFHSINICNPKQDERKNYLQFVFLAVNNNSADLLVHEDEDSNQKGRDEAGQINPPGVLTKRHHQPPTSWPGRLEGDISMWTAAGHHETLKIYSCYSWSKPHLSGTGSFHRPQLSQYLKLRGHNQFGSFQSHQHIESHKCHDGHEDGEVADEFPQLERKT